MGFPVDPTNYSNLFELDNRQIVVAAFNSCYGNDCFNYVGMIPPSEIARSHLAILQSDRQYRLKMAVWHHDVSGPPARVDYMDRDLVKLMIDKGFRLGLHGHQHKANAAPDWVYTARQESMVVISAGSLCAGTYDVPRGVGREYNVIEIAPCYTKARVHVREAKVSNIFAAGRFIELGDQSYRNVQWAAEENDSELEAGPKLSGEPLLSLVSRIEAMIAEGNTSDALSELAVHRASLGKYGRMLTSTALSQANDWHQLERHLARPESIEEIILLVTSMTKQKRWQQARDVLKSDAAHNLLTGSMARELEQTVNTEEAISA